MPTDNKKKLVERHLTIRQELTKELGELTKVVAEAEVKIGGIAPVLDTYGYEKEIGRLEELTKRLKQARAILLGTDKVELDWRWTPEA